MEQVLAASIAPATSTADLAGAALALAFVLVLVGTAGLVIARVIQSGREDDLLRRVAALEREVESLKEDRDDDRE